MNNKNNIPIISASIYIVFYALATAASLVLINLFEVSLDPILLVLYTFTISAVLFILINARTLSKLITKSRHHLKPVIALNISTAVTWITLFYALLYISPSISSALIFGVIPIATTILTLKKPKTTKVKTYEFLFSGLIAIILISLSADDIIEHIDKWTIFIGIILVVISGIAAAYNNIYARELSLKEFTATEVLSVRFFMLILLVLILVFILQKPWAISFVIVGHAFIIAAISIILPLFFLQKAIEKVEPVYIAFLLPFTPVITFFLQLFETRYEFSLVNFIHLMILSVVLFISVLVKYHLEKYTK